MDGSPDPPDSVYTSPHLMTFHPTASPNYLITTSHCVDFPFALHFIPFELIRTNTFLEFALAAGPGLPLSITSYRSVSVIVYSRNCAKPFPLVGFYFNLVALIHSYTFFKQAVATKPGLSHFVTTLPVCVCDSLFEAKCFVSVREIDIDQEDMRVVYHFVIIVLIRTHNFLEHAVATGPGLPPSITSFYRSVSVIVRSRKRVASFFLVEFYVLLALFRSYTVLKQAVATKPGLSHPVTTLPVCVCDSLLEETCIVAVFEFDIDQDDMRVV
jgi:hypothetical protein